MTAQDIYKMPVTTLAGHATTLANYRGKHMLIVNVASECGLTPQYKGLEELHREFGDGGLVVCGFPCNQFGAQEPGTAEQIQAFCTKNYGVTFPMFAKVDVNGPGEHPLFTWLKKEDARAGGKPAPEPIKWNFAKFLVSPQGTLLKRFAPQTTPADMLGDIQKALSTKA